MSVEANVAKWGNQHEIDQNIFRLRQKLNTVEAARRNPLNGNNQTDLLNQRRSLQAELACWRRVATTMQQLNQALKNVIPTSVDDSVVI